VICRKYKSRLSLVEPRKISNFFSGLKSSKKRKIYDNLAYGSDITYVRRIYGLNRMESRGKTIRKLAIIWLMFHTD
jgi:hypothetical protein